MTLMTVSNDHFKTLMEEDLASIKGQKAYCESALTNTLLKPWEVKEYSGLVSNYEAQIQVLEQRLDNMQFAAKASAEAVSIFELPSSEK